MFVNNSDIFTEPQKLRFDATWSIRCIGKMVFP